MRRTARARFLGSLSVVVGTLCLPAVARSEPASDEPRALLSQNAAAVEAGRAALDAYQRRDWAEAFEQFHAAEALAHSPVFLLFMARTKERQGELLAALDLYARVLAEPTVSEMPDAWLRAIEAAGVERLAVLARVPSLIIVLARNHPPGTIVMVDDVPFERAGTELLLNPGAHEIVARSPGRTDTRKRLTLVEGRKRVRIELPASEPPAPARLRSELGAAKPGVQRRNGLYSVLAFGSAAALLSTSGYFAWRADRASDRVTRAFADGEPWTRSLSSSERDGERSQVIAIATLGAGLLAAGIGTWVAVFD